MRKNDTLTGAPRYGRMYWLAYVEGETVRILQPEEQEALQRQGYETALFVWHAPSGRYMYISAE